MNNFFLGFNFNSLFRSFSRFWLFLLLRLLFWFYRFYWLFNLSFRNLFRSLSRFWLFLLLLWRCFLFDWFNWFFCDNWFLRLLLLRRRSIFYCLFGLFCIFFSYYNWFFRSNNFIILLWFDWLIFFSFWLYYRGFLFWSLAALRWRRLSSRGLYGLFNLFLSLFWLLFFLILTLRFCFDRFFRCFISRALFSIDNRFIFNRSFWSLSWCLHCLFLWLDWSLFFTLLFFRSWLCSGLGLRSGITICIVWLLLIC